MREKRGREGGEREEDRQREGGGQGFWVGEKGWWEREGLSRRERKRGWGGRGEREMRGEMVGEGDLEKEGKERMGEEQRTRDLGTKEAPQEEQGKELRREGRGRGAF